MKPNIFRKANIFRVGTHTDSTGSTQVWTLEDLQQMVNNFQKTTVMLRLGHAQPKSGTPAVGWVEKVWIEKDTLVAELSLTPEGEKIIGNYRQRSIGLRFGKKGWVIDHLALLSAEKPAIDDLGSAFSAVDNEPVVLINFSEGDMDDIVEALQAEIKALKARNAELIDASAAFASAMQAELVKFFPKQEAEATALFAELPPEIAPRLIALLKNREETPTPSNLPLGLSQERVFNAAQQPPVTMGAFIPTPEQLGAALKAKQNA